jgi:hypothetical protein
MKGLTENWIAEKHVYIIFFEFLDIMEGLLMG